MKKYFVMLALVISTVANAQNYDESKINKKALEVYEKAIVKLRDGEIKDAIPLLKKAYELDNRYVDAILSLGGAYGELKNYQAAVQQYEKGRLMDTFYFRYYYLPYSINLAGLGKFDKALEAINKFLSIPELNERSRKSGQYRKGNYEFALKYAQTNPAGTYVFAPVNLGDSVNSARSEYYPSITIDDSMLVFTRRGETREDFFESTILKNKKYSKSRLINGDLNLEARKGALSISQDGDWLIFAGEFSEGMGSFDLYISYSTPNGWSDPEILGRSVNSEAWDSGPTLSPDKKSIFFSSNRLGGYGGSDIYVSHRQPNGRWSVAENMGPQINTKGDEQAPFIHADNSTLYFTSDGLPGYGDKDLFVCRRGPNNQWSVPQNLGYPINTIDSEGSLFVSADGKTAFYASDRSDSRGGLDIYTFELRPDVRPAKTLYVKGKVYDQKTGKGLPSALELIDNTTQQTVTKIQTDETGNYFMTLPVGKDYNFSVNRKGYLFFSELYPLSKSAPDSVYKKDIALQPVEVNASIVLKNILFETNSAQLQNISLVELNKLLQLMAENPTVQVQINGHTDNVGKPAENLKLSTARAKSVVDYLVEKGIKLSRLTYKGFGETKPIGDNKTEAGRALNRRTEFVVIAN